MVTAKDLYIYAVTRIHGSEQGLLSRRELEQMALMPNAGECFRFLADKGWSSGECAAQNADGLIAAEQESTWALIEELAGDMTLFNMFLYSNDYHNLKAAIKLNYASDDSLSEDSVLIKHGTIDTDIILKAVKEHSFEDLPFEMAVAGRTAYEALNHTANGQVCDMIIDKAALMAIWAAGKSSKSEVLRKYSEITVDSSNIKSAVRCSIMHKNQDFIRSAIAPCGTLDAQTLAEAAARDIDAICEYLSITEYASAVSSLKKSMSAFEKWCDDEMMEMIRPQRFNCFTLEPLAAFILGRENEIRMVRLILSAKTNGLDSRLINERLRETYV